MPLPQQTVPSTASGAAAGERTRRTAPEDGAERSPSPPPAPPPAPASRGRDEDADLLLDVAQLSVDEVSLEIEASAGIDHIKLDAKGLNTGLFLKASLDNVVALRGLEPVRGATPGRPPAGARHAELTGGERGRPGGRPSPGRRDPSEDGDGDHDGLQAVLDGVRRRAAAAVKEGGKTASVAVAGAAGGALLESRLGHGGRRRLRSMLPGGRRSHALPTLARSAERASKALIDRAQQRLP